MDTLNRTAKQTVTEVWNPRLASAIEELRLNRAPETVTACWEALLSSTVLVPLNGAAAVRSNWKPGEIIILDVREGDQLPIRVITRGDSKMSIPAFTDTKALRESLPDGCVCAAMTAEFLLPVCLQHNTASLVLNPHSKYSAVFGRQAIEGLLMAVKIERTPDPSDDPLPTNARLKQAIHSLTEAPGAAAQDGLYEALVQGAILVAVDDGASDAQIYAGGAVKKTGFRTALGPDGQPVLLGFTDADSLYERFRQGQAFTCLSAQDFLQRVVESGLTGAVINPAGPWAFISADEARLLLKRAR